MIETIKNIDTQLFLKLNSLNSNFFDVVMTAISGQILWFPFFAAIIFLFFRKNTKKYAILGLIFLIAAVSLADFSSVHAFKNVFQRLRPCHNPIIAETVHLVNNHCGGRFGFVSSHSANFFALAMFSSLFIKKKLFTYIAFFIAAIVAYSRIYLGVHYPADIIGGAALGVFISFILYKIFHRFFKKQNTIK